MRIGPLVNGFLEFSHGLSLGTRISLSGLASGLKGEKYNPTIKPWVSGHCEGDLLSWHTEKEFSPLSQQHLTPIPNIALKCHEGNPYVMFPSQGQGIDLATARLDGEQLRLDAACFQNEKLLIESAGAYSIPVNNVNSLGYHIQCVNTESVNKPSAARGLMTKPPHVQIDGSRGNSLLISREPFVEEIVGRVFEYIGIFIRDRFLHDPDPKIDFLENQKRVLALEKNIQGQARRAVAEYHGQNLIA